MLFVSDSLLPDCDVRMRGSCSETLMAVCWWGLEVDQRKVFVDRKSRLSSQRLIIVSTYLLGAG